MSDEQSNDIKRLTKSSDNVVIAGIAGGIGEYLNIDPVVVRLVFLFGLVPGGWAFPLYILLWFVIPEKGHEHAQSSSKTNKTVEVPEQGKAKNDELHYARPIKDIDEMRDKLKDE